MSVGEQGTQPPSLYNELFTGFAGMAALHGAINHGPLDAAQEPGKNGTLTPDGGQATGFDYVISEEQIPSSLQLKGIDKLSIGSYTSTAMGDSVWPERTWVHVHEKVGLTRYVMFSRGSRGEIEADFSLEADPFDRVENNSDISDKEKDEIMQALFAGDGSWLRFEGPAGDFARAIHLRLTAPDEPDASDIELLQEILAELE
jgi:hypothetical protein